MEIILAIRCFCSWGDYACLCLLCEMCRASIQPRINFPLSVTWGYFSTSWLIGNESDFERYFLPKRIYCFMKAKFTGTIFSSTSFLSFFTGRRKKKKIPYLHFFLRTQLWMHCRNNEEEGNGEGMTMGRKVYYWSVFDPWSNRSGHFPLSVKQEDGSQGLPVERSVDSWQGGSYKVVLFDSQSIPMTKFHHFSWANSLEFARISCCSSLIFYPHIQSLNLSVGKMWSFLFTSH